MKLFQQIQQNRFIIQFIISQTNTLSLIYNGLIPQNKHFSSSGQSHPMGGQAREHVKVPKARIRTGSHKGHQVLLDSKPQFCSTMFCMSNQK